MYCLKGTSQGVDDADTNSAAQPLYELGKVDWWMHHFNDCDQFPPADGDFLELPAIGDFTIELAANRAFTSLSYNGMRTAMYGDGQEHPGLGVTLEGKADASTCIASPNIHTQNKSMAAGTSFAISYTSDISQVTEDNLAVFTVLPNTPWRRLATYMVPNLPACPAGGCICTWGWVPNNCGGPNMYMQPFRCKVTGNTGDRAISPATAPLWCENDQSRCVSGAKQMVFFNQLEGNNVELSGFDRSGQPRIPTYDTKMGFTAGAQRDIFDATATVDPTFIPPSSTPTLANQANPRFNVEECLLVPLFTLGVTAAIILP